MYEEQIKWSQYPEILNRLLELDARNYTQGQIAVAVREEYPEIAKRLPTRDQVKNALVYARARAEYITDRPITDIMPYYNAHVDAIRGVVNVEKDAALLQSLLSKPRLKILVLSDIHVPFTDEVALQRAIELNRSADYVVLGGDTLDMYGCSRHRKRRSVPHEVELDNGVRLLEYLSQTFPWVEIIDGNHDDRVMSKVRDTLPAELLYLVEHDTLDLLSRPFPNVVHTKNWWTQVGDAIVAHAKISSRIEGQPAVKLSEFFLTKGWDKRLNLGELRCFVQAHTHQVSTVYRENLKMFESGCVAQAMEYTLDSDAFMRPPMKGCVSIVQYNGKTDFNESREYLL